MNADSGRGVSIYMTNKPTPPKKEKDSLTPKEKEIQTLFARGKSPETIAIRMGMKISKVLMVLAMVPKPLI
ncbi:helix-turn-helix transcriptional regulator [Prosthecobacter sp.]|uniref:helix-turn-helix transcriptional regulator n=1 Tax=Prosthecobacter sp. TaxID=1965333 RepID=UPI003BB07194